MSGSTKRRSSEKRKEKSRDAARNRRSQEAEIFSQLCSALPVPSNVQAQLDKSSVMRIAISHLKLSKIIETSLDEEDKTDHLWMKALDGFVLVLSQDVDIIFVSESVAKYLGISQIDLIGQSLLEFLHPCDHDEVIDHLSHKSSTKSKTLFLRMKCTLTSKGRSVNLKSASYKVIKLSGEFKDFQLEDVKDDNKENKEQRYYVGVGEPIPHPADIDIKLDSKTFLSKHNMDMSFTYCDERITDLVGFDNDKLVGESIYNYHHALDSENLEKSYKQLFSKGQVMTDRYRFLAKNGGYVWVVTQATIIYNNRTHRPESVVCVHYTLSDVIEKKVIFASFQKASTDSMLKFFKPMTEDVFRPKSELQDEDMYIAPGLTKSMMSDTTIDLTHLAPMAGDVCIPLPCSAPQNEELDKADELFPSFKREPESFMACRGVDKPKSTGTTPIASPALASPQTPEDYRTAFDPNDTDIMSTFFSEALPSSGGDDQFEEIDLNMRAPYIPMTPDEDFHLLGPSSDDLLSINKDFNPWFQGRTESVFLPKEKIFPEQPKESAPSLRDLLEAQNVVSCIARPQDQNTLQMKRPLDKSSLEKGPPVKRARTQVGLVSGQKAKSSFDSVLLNLLLTGEDKQNGYSTKDLTTNKATKARTNAALNISKPALRTITQGQDIWQTLKLMTPDVSL